jgi:hypothetical protein
VDIAEAYYKENPDVLEARAREFAEALASVPQPVLTLIVGHLNPSALRRRVEEHLGLVID